MDILIRTNGDKMSIDHDLDLDISEAIQVICHAAGLLLTRHPDKFTMYQIAQEALSRYIDTGEMLYNLSEESLN